MTFSAYLWRYIKWWLGFSAALLAVQVLLHMELAVGYAYAMLVSLWILFVTARRAGVLNHFWAIMPIHVALSLAGYFALGFASSVVR
jgi:hypothetical protein